MRISRKAEYALRALVAIARARKSWQIHELSARENIPVKFLEQILLALRRAGILTSKRGVGGGYALQADPRRVTVAEVIRIMDGPIAPVPCAVDPAADTCRCPDPARCAVRLVMTDLRNQIETALASQSIADLVNLTPGTAPIAYEI